MRLSTARQFAFFNCCALTRYLVARLSRVSAGCTMTGIQPEGGWHDVGGKTVFVGVEVCVAATFCVSVGGKVAVAVTGRGEGNN